MNTKRPSLPTMLPLVLALQLILGWPNPAQAQTKKSSRTSSAKAPSVTLNFVNAEIDSVARTIATLTNRNVVVDPRVKGVMNLSTEKPVGSGEAFNQFLSALRLQGFTVVEAGGLYKVVPEADAKLQGGSSTVAAPGERVQAAGNQIVTQIFKLNFESANNLVPILRPLISPNNTINVNPGNNSLIITDYSENLARMARIIAAMDVSNATDLEIVPLKNGIANELAPLVSRLMDASSASIGGAPGAPGGGADSSFRTTIVAESRSNALIIRAANPARLALARSLINQLDQPAAGNNNGAAGNIHVVYLKNADAVKLAVTLRAALQASASAGQAGGGPAGGGSIAPASSSVGNTATAPIAASAQPSTGGQIQADPATNSLIITASDPQMRQLRAVIEKLDARRAQVFVESLIAEVNASKAAAFGVQWQSALGNRGDANVGVLGTNFGSGGGNILSLATQGATGTLLPNAGLNLGIAHQTNGFYVLGALANFLESTGDGNVLSTPNLLTLDNEEAKIVVGQNVPFLTGQFTNNTSGGATNPFQTIERKDVGITLRVKPQISENGTIKMTIFQEVSSIDTSSSSTQGLVTNKRSLESNVVVEDGSVVVLGGLLQDNASSNQQRVPGLASIPWLGALFRSETKSRVKTNLMVFLRPVIVRDGASTEALSLSRYENMRALQLDRIEQDRLNSTRFNYGVPVMPEAPMLKSTPTLRAITEPSVK